MLLKANYRLNVTASTDKSISVKNKTLTNAKNLHWEKSVASKTLIYNFVEIPLTYTHKITPTVAIVSNPNAKPTPNQKIIDASFDRLVIYKDKRGKINQRIISFIPDEAYLTRHKNNISHNRINKLDKDFDGYLHYKDWDGKVLFVLRIKNGEPVKKYDMRKSKSGNFTPPVKANTQSGKLMVLPDVNDDHCYFVTYDWYQDCYYQTPESEFPYWCDPVVIYNVNYLEIPCNEDDGGAGGGDGGSAPDEDCLGVVHFATGECIEEEQEAPPEKLDSILKDTCLNTQQMLNLRLMFDSYLDGDGNAEWACLRKKQYDLMKSLGVKFGFCIKDLPGAVQSYDPKKDIFYFTNETALNYTYNFDHEFFHGYQNKSLTNGTLPYASITNPSTGVTTYPDGFINLEFETALYIDIVRSRDDQSAFVTSTVPSAIKTEYLNWLNTITENNTKYPKTFADFGGQYFYFMEKFKQYSGYSDKGNIITNMTPITLLNLFSTTNCK